MQLFRRASFLVGSAGFSPCLRSPLKLNRIAELWTVSRAAIVSIAAAAVEIVVLHFGLVPAMPHWAGFALVQVIGNTATFLSYKYWAFAASRKGSTTKQYFRQVVVFGGTWILNTAFPSLLHYRFGVRPSLAFGISCAVFYIAWSYPLNRWWVFRGVKPQAGAVPKPA
jgi:putative flippase GtrA